ncbi:sulfhydryl oxidase 2-like [Athalia rosae]|uniref:sulfhydryl oxidase 2-like n=1 Tax=Athalia rosae TaxID=37344 RepID=UPI002033CEDB|nr:sulfhydryl oxidase 2-like [Athalia rosae]XP_048511389.1 sulfhydryl oxidase 2-like [Athalia rosae]
MSSNAERYRIAKLLVKTLLVQILILQRASAAVVGHKEDYQSSATGEGLYSTSDGIFILNATNLKSNIYESKTAWLVEFYNSWCGYCHRFAPTWKALAQDIEHWKDIVVIAAMDCANDDNNPVCRDFEVMHYPMLKFFSVDAKVGNLGIELDSGKDMNTIRHNLVNRLEKEQQEDRGSTWPNIAPYRSSDTKNLWKDIPESVKYNFLIFEVVDSYLATEVTLDLHKFDSLQVRGVTSENEPLTISLGVNKFPTVIALGRDGTQQTINARYLTREGLRKAIKDFLMLTGIVIGNPEDHSKDGTLTKSTEAPNKIEEAKDEKELEEIRTIGDVLFQLDLETALRYSIEHEIPMSKVIDGEKLEALKAYLNVLAKYFPLRRSGVLFLDALREIIDRRKSLSGVELRQIIKSVEEEMSPIYSGPKRWIGCKGSMEHLRGYPCGLWTMFHMLTVNAANHNKNIKEYPPQEVLRAMYGYIKHFFGCSDCSQHFVEMAAKDKMFQVQTIDEAILWLWRSHNQVNKRLAGDETEDPEYKKIQYPSKEQCSTCRYSNSSWNEVKVLRYMYRKYSYTGINYYNSSGKPDDDDTGDDLKIRQGRFALDKYTGQRRLGWDFTIFDISICVVLYVMSATILVLVCIKFAVKRTYRKKTYIHDLFGKV